EVTLRGWLYNKRVKGKIAFLMIRDGSGVVQCVAVKNEIGDAKFAVCDHVPQESSLELVGTVRADERSPGGVEVGLKDLRVIAEAGRAAAGARRGDPLDPRILRRSRVHLRGFPDPDSGGLRGDVDAVPGRLLRRKSLPDAERPALWRGGRDGDGPDILLRPDL